MRSQPVKFLLALPDAQACHALFRHALRAADHQALGKKVVMKRLISYLGFVLVLTVCLFVLPTASADDLNKETIVTFSAPFEVPGVGEHLLPAGTYVFKVMTADITDRHIVRIYSQDKTKVFTTIMAIPNYRLVATGKTVITFKERAQGQPEALRAWFYPGDKWGEEFVYTKLEAVELAKISDVPVLYTDIEAPTEEALLTVPVEAIKPTGEVVPVAEVVMPLPTAQAAPVEVAKVEAPEPMPQTASYLPLLACIGLLSLAGAGVISKYSA